MQINQNASIDWAEDRKNDLVMAVVSLRNMREVERFLSDLLTAREIEDCAKRLRAAVLLDQNTPYLTIQEATGLSSSTIANISRILHKGYGGFVLAIVRLTRLSSLKSELVEKDGYLATLLKNISH